MEEQLNEKQSHKDINELLGDLYEELEKLKSSTFYIESANKNLQVAEDVIDISKKLFEEQQIIVSNSERMIKDLESLELKDKINKYQESLIRYEGKINNLIEEIRGQYKSYSKKIEQTNSNIEKTHQDYCEKLIRHEKILLKKHKINNYTNIAIILILIGLIIFTYLER